MLRQLGRLYSPMCYSIIFLLGSAFGMFVGHSNLDLRRDFIVLVLATVAFQLTQTSHLRLFAKKIKK